MKTTGELIIFGLTLMALAASAYAQSPRDELKQMVVQLQEKPYDHELREKIIKLALTLKPAPEVPEEARRSFIIGEALFKQAKSLKPAYQAADAFGVASNLAPWWGDAYWNEAVAYQTVGQYALAKISLKFYLLTNPGAADRRVAQDRLYAIDADKAVADSATLPSGLIGFWQRSSYQDMTTFEWKNDDPESSRSDVYEIQQAGSSYTINCMKCDNSSPQTKWSMNVVSASDDAVTFQMRLVSPWYDSGIDSNECKLGGPTLNCTSTDKDGKKFFTRYAKRSVCEIVGGPGITGYFVICK